MIVVVPQSLYRDPLPEGIADGLAGEMGSLPTSLGTKLI